MSIVDTASTCAGLLPDTNSERPSAFEGYVDRFSDGQIAGWVWSPAAPSTPIEVEVLLAGAVVATARADRFRGDLVEAGVGSGFHGFGTEIPCAPGLGQNPVVRVRGTERILPWLDSAEGPGAGLADVADRRQVGGARPGVLEFVAPHLVQGWARNVREPGAPVPVLVCQGDEALTRGLADEPRGDLSGIGARQFSIALPAHDARTASEIRCFIENDGTLVPLPALPSGGGSARAGGPWADFEIVTSSRVSGWVAEGGGDRERLVEVLQDDRVVWRGQARRLLGVHSIGFRADLPPPADWTKEIEIGVRLGRGGKRIGRTRRFRPIDRFRGNVEIATLTHEAICVSGWVQDLARPLDSLEVELHVDGRRVCSAKADEHRADLEATRIETGRHGFCLRHKWVGEPPAKVSVIVGGYDAPVFPGITLEAERAPEDTRQSSRRTTVPGPKLRSSPVDGSLDSVRPDGASGWARYRDFPDEPVLIDLYVDNCHYYSVLTGQHRADVAKKFGDHGNHGFFFELPPYVRYAQDIELRISPRYGKAAFSTAARRLERCPNGRALNSLPALEPSAVRPSAGATAQSAAKIAYIVLNLNGAHLLAQLFASFERHNRYPRYEILVVDHGSVDDSIALCTDWSSRLNIRVLARGENHSFSASNNHGARDTDAEIIVFLNNDIVFAQDVGAELVRLLGDDSIGCVGIKLLDSPLDGSFSPASIQHLGIHFNGMHRQSFVHPLETRYAPHLWRVAQDALDVPAVTGALLACRRTEFLESGGFDEGYYYGYEDVDHCLGQVLKLRKRIVCANQVVAFHARGYSRRQAGKGLDRRLAENNKRLQEKFGVALRRRQNADRFERPGFWTSIAPRIAFAVTEASESTAAGDYFTALELARDLVEELRCQVVFLDKRENWFDLSGIDVLVTMRDDYDLRKIQNAPPHLLRIGWVRNWMDRWADREWASDYDVLWASSDKAKAYLSRVLARPIEVVRIATSPARFATGRPRAELASDYCFTGSYFGAPREILYHLDPSALPFDFAVYGHGWEAVPQFARYCRGPLPYGAMPDVYASTKIVIDDANSATKQWHSVNSRVFDALAAGALVITNGAGGAKEIFGDALPSYSNSQELEALLWKYLSDEKARLSLVSRLRGLVEKEHTYRHRAVQVVSALRAVSRAQIRIAIKIGTPCDAVREEWGDYHFAVGLKRALTRLGHAVRIDCLDRWEGAHCLGDEAVIVLRGLSCYEPKPHQANLMWNISHPDAISRTEYEKYDHVFVASTNHAAALRELLDTPVEPLLQCTDLEVFHPDLEPIADAPELLFVGNSRNVYRKIVRQAVELGLPLEVHGTRWEGMIPAFMIKSQNVPNSELGRLYKGAGAVLNDHWHDMCRHGFLSNRLFDAAAAGAFVITDRVAGIEEIFADSMYVVNSPDGLAAAARLPDEQPERVGEMRRRASEIARLGHTFDHRAAEICRAIERVVSRMTKPEEEVR